MDTFHPDRAEAIRMEQLFARQKSAAATMPYPGLREREARLLALKAMLLKHQDEWIAAVSADFGHRSAVETRFAELAPSLEGIRHARRHLARWMKPRRRGVSIWYRPASNSILPQPLGVVGVIVPWNYPIFLAFGPLVSALAAGNRVMVKMSEYTPRTGALLQQLAALYLGDEVVAVLNGGPDVAQSFSALPFDHLLFTGSTEIGKRVMRAASANLTPVTLELGGKSPALVAPDFPLDLAASRIAFGKLLNAGQTCVAPDYVLVPRGRLDLFVELYRREVARMYPSLCNNPDYTAIVNQRHFDRLRSWLDEAAAAGATVVEINPAAENLSGSGKLAPHLVLDAPDGSRVMQDEIFGPILPVIPYDDFNAALDYINAHPRPLALYLFDRDNRRIGHTVARTHAGGVSINETILHVAQDDLPFGGVGSSGMGHYHGKDGFDTFSKLKPVFAQSRINGLGLLTPPYGRVMNALLKLLLR